MRLRFVLPALLAFPALALAQSASFDLVVDGKLSGHDTYNLAKDKHGYKLSSRLAYSFHAQEGHFVDEIKLKQDYSYIEASVSVESEQPLLISYVPNKTLTEMTIGRVQAGSQVTDFFPIKPNFFLLPLFDAGAAQILLYAAIQPSAPSTFNIYVPSQGDSRMHGSSADAQWAKGPDVAATLDGKTLPVHTFLLHTSDFRWIFYADDAHTLLRCDLPTGKTNYIRQGFKLTDSPPAPAAFDQH